MLIKRENDFSRKCQLPTVCSTVLRYVWGLRGCNYCKQNYHSRHLDFLLYIHLIPSRTGLGVSLCARSTIKCCLLSSYATLIMASFAVTVRCRFVAAFTALLSILVECLDVHRTTPRQFVFFCRCFDAAGRLAVLLPWWELKLERNM